MTSRDPQATRDLVASALRGELSRRELISRSTALGVSAPLVAGIFALSGEDAGAENLQATPASGAAPAASREDLAYEIGGLEGPAEILVDQWGIPHMYASSLYDAFVVQGFNAARDRLWQIDLWRRRGLGQLSTVFGEKFVDQDRAARPSCIKATCTRNGWPTVPIRRRS